MKKTYQAPRLNTLALSSEDSVLTGMSIIDKTVTDPKDIDSARGGWDSSNWSGSDDED